jgi:hypothetical protein
MPPEFHRAAALIYDMLREFKGADPASIEDVLRKLDGIHKSQAS